MCYGKMMVSMLHEVEGVRRIARGGQEPEDDMESCGGERHGRVD